MTLTSASPQPPAAALGLPIPATPPPAFCVSPPVVAAPAFYGLAPWVSSSPLSAVPAARPQQTEPVAASNNKNVLDH